MLTYEHEKYGTRKNDYIFMQDNASVLTERKYKRWFKDNKVKLLSWPTLSPDLSPIENVCGALAKAIY